MSPVREFTPTQQKTPIKFAVNSQSFTPSGFTPSKKQAPFTMDTNSYSEGFSFEKYRNQGNMGDAPKPFTINKQIIANKAGSFVPTPHDANGNYKTQLCRDWIYQSKCKHEVSCPYAHSQMELTKHGIASYGNCFKQMNCREFSREKYCPLGSKCIFRHEHRTMQQLHRHYYTSHIYTYESLYESRPSEQAKRTFAEEFVPATTRLPIFDEIHLHGIYEKYNREFEGMASFSDNELPDFVEEAQIVEKEQNYSEVNEKQTCSTSSSFLNTTQEDSSDEAGVFPRMVKLACFAPTLSKLLDSDVVAVYDTTKEEDCEENQQAISLSSAGIDFI